MTIEQGTNADSARVALVLGGSGGIGAAVCLRLARTHTVAIGCRPDNAVSAGAVLAAIREAGGLACAAPGDATTTAGVEAAFDAAASAGAVTTVVHCVGAWNFTRLTDIDEQDLDEVYAVNLRSAILALGVAGRRIADHGRIVMISSAAAVLAPARQVTYAAMKAGVEAASRAAARELARRSVAVNVVRPGATDTPRLRRTTAGRAVEAMTAASAFRRLGEPDDIAAVVEYLVSDGASWLTGTVVDASNGLT